MLCHRAELCEWRRRLEEWRRECAHTLHDEFEQETFEEFLRATLRVTERAEDSRRTLAEEVRRVENAVALLLALDGTLERKG